MNPHRKPHACTDTIDSPYASIRAMNTPASRLLNAASAISIASPGTSRMASTAPRTSTCLVSVSDGTGTGSSIVIERRCTSDHTVSASAP
jgi:hypothetical protein